MKYRDMTAICLQGSNSQCGFRAAFYGVPPTEILQDLGVPSILSKSEFSLASIHTVIRSAKYREKDVFFAEKIVIIVIDCSGV